MPNPPPFLRTVLTLFAGAALAASGSAQAAANDATWARLAPFFTPPEEYARLLSPQVSPLTFYDGRPVREARDWPERRQEILTRWHALMGPWPELLPRPQITFAGKSHRENFTQHRVQVEIAADYFVAGYLLVPDGPGPFPAVFVPYYEPETSIGLKEELRDFAVQLTRRGFVTLSIGSPGGDARQPELRGARCQPLAFLAYVAANCHTILAQRPEVDPARIGIVGHSYGGKWAMFASCLYDKYACSAWSDPGIVFDDTKQQINYWEPWYLGFDGVHQRKRGIPSDANPAYGPYRTMRETGRDLTELHALMAPRPFLVSGGAEDRPVRWTVLNHAIAVNELLGFRNRVAMTNRPDHVPNAESNEIIYLFFEHFLKNRP